MILAMSAAAGPVPESFWYFAGAILLPFWTMPFWLYPLMDWLEKRKAAKAKGGEEQ